MKVGDIITKISISSKITDLMEPPVSTTGLKAEDLIMVINEKPVTNIEDYFTRLNAAAVKIGAWETTFELYFRYGRVRLYKVTDW